VVGVAVGAGGDTEATTSVGDTHAKHSKADTAATNGVNKSLVVPVVVVDVGQEEEGADTAAKPVGTPKRGVDSVVGRKTCAANTAAAVAVVEEEEVSPALENAPPGAPTSEHPNHSDSSKRSAQLAGTYTPPSFIPASP
jgi:hypothetical protein